MDDPYLDTPLPVDTHRDVAPHSVSPQPESCSLPLPYTQLCILPVFSRVWPTRGSSTLVPTIVSPPSVPANELHIFSAAHPYGEHRCLRCSPTLFGQRPLPGHRSLATAIHSTSRCGTALASPRRSSHLTTFAASWEHYNIVDSHHDVVQDVGHIRFSRCSLLKVCYEPGF
jgi:hypothetical protein